MADAQDKSESLDDDKIGDDFPPDEPLGADAYGEAGAEPGAPESVVRRSAREEPEELPLQPLATRSDPELGALADGDDFSGDASLRETVQEAEAPVAAEEAAMHVVDESLGGFDSEVDDPELAAAYEIDPQPER